MSELRVIETVRNSNKTIDRYVIENAEGKRASIEAYELKRRIKDDGVELENYKLTKDNRLSKMRKKGLGAEITVIKVSGILGTNEDKSRRVLNSLVDKGVLAKRRVGKRNIYTLKIV